jgi:hypothetical protein
VIARPIAGRRRRGGPRSDAARMLRSYAAHEWRALAVAALSTLAVVISYLARPLQLAG